MLLARHFLAVFSSILALAAAAANVSSSFITLISILTCLSVTIPSFSFHKKNRSVGAITIQFKTGNFNCRQTGISVVARREL
jgi:hypothetical protein